MNRALRNRLSNSLELAAFIVLSHLYEAQKSAHSIHHDVYVCIHNDSFLDLWPPICVGVRHSFRCQNHVISRTRRE